MAKLLDKMFIDLNDVKRKRRNIIPPSSPKAHNLTSPKNPVPLETFFVIFLYLESDW